MGLISRMIGGPGAIAVLGRTAREVSEVFLPNATRAMELAHVSGQAALSQHGAEFTQPSCGWFDRLVNGLNRLPRPMLALGTLGLFIYAMIQPEGFARRMQGLALVPEPLWWLLGAIVAFYFGARETHYLRHRGGAGAALVDTSDASGRATPSEMAGRLPMSGSENPALELWAHRAGER